MHIRGRVKNRGPLLQLPCPDCEVPRWFHLKEQIAAFRIFGLPLSKTSLFGVECIKCHYIIILPEGDIQKCIDFLPTAAAFADDRMTAAEFQGQLAAAEFQFLQEFAKANTPWTCPQCGEESPLTFGSCWNCGEAHKDAADLSEATEGKRTFLDEALKPKGGTFGGMEL